MMLIVSCSEKEEPAPRTLDPLISSISPQKGSKGSTVILEGEGFSTSLSDNVVKFNGIEAVLNLASSSRLEATVPENAGDGSVTVTVAGKTVAGPVFDYIETYTVSTFAGRVRDYADGVGSNASFFSPVGLVADVGGNLYVADDDNHRIRKITSEGVVTTVAGNGVEGYADGASGNAQFFYPSGITVDANQNLYVADFLNSIIRKITSTGDVITFAGNTVWGYADGAGSNVMFRGPYGITTDAAGNLYIADNQNHRIRKITPAGEVSTLAGSGVEGYADGIGAEAQFNEPRGIAIDGIGNLYVIDYNHRIRKITPAGEVSTLAGSGVKGYADGIGTEAQFS